MMPKSPSAIFTGKSASREGCPLRLRQKAMNAMDENAPEDEPMQVISLTDRLEDARLLRQVAEGDERALEDFYSRYFSRVYRYVYYRVGADHHHAEEAVNDTFMEAIKKADGYDPERGSIEAWLITLSRNRIRANNAAMGRQNDYERSWSMLDGEMDAFFADLDGGNLPESALINEELAQLVGAAMSSLPEEYAKLLEMKYIRDLPVREMATALHKTEKAIESQLTRARLAFRDVFKSLAADVA